FPPVFPGPCSQHDRVQCRRRAWTTDRAVPHSAGHGALAVDRRVRSPCRARQRDSYDRRIRSDGVSVSRIRNARRENLMNPATEVQSLRLPARSGLMIRTLISLAVAAVIVFCFILPAEFHRDPTHLGQLMGLMALSKPAPVDKPANAALGS